MCWNIFSLDRTHTVHDGTQILSQMSYSWANINRKCTTFLFSLYQVRKTGCNIFTYWHSPCLVSFLFLSMVRWLFCMTKLVHSLGLYNNIQHFIISREIYRCCSSVITGVVESLICRGDQEKPANLLQSTILQKKWREHKIVGIKDPWFIKSHYWDFF